MKYSKNELATTLAKSAKTLIEIWPEQIDNIDIDREAADLAVEGTILYVYNGVNRHRLGRKNIDWNHDWVTRFPMLGPLSRQWQKTGKTCYAEAAVDYIESYMAAFPVVPPAANRLSLGGRNATIAAHLHSLATSLAADEEFLNRAIAHITREMNWLHDNITSTINWRVFNARCLLSTALYLRFLPDSRRWMDLAVPVLNDALYRQFRPDMTHYECNPCYHHGMAATYFDLWKLAQKMPELGLKITLDQLVPMYEFIAALSRPNGYLCAIHDSQGDRTGNQKTAKGQAAYGGQKGVNPLEVYDKFRRDAGLADSRPETSRFFPDAGLGLFRTGWGEDDQYVTFDATRWGGGHCHLSRNAIQLHAFRRSMVVDPGWLAYNDDAVEWGAHGRSTRAHSTCTLNGLSQLSTNPSRTDYYHAAGYDAVHSVYDGGYWDTHLQWTFRHATRGLWASHTRTMFWVQKKFLFIVDSIFRLPHTPGDPQDERPSVECNWQLSEDADLTLAPDASRAVAQWPEGNLLMLFPIRPAGSTLTSHCGEKNPLRGWLPGENDYLPAHQVCVFTERMDKQHDYFVSILIPSLGHETPEVEVESKSPLGRVGYVKLKWKDGTSDEIHWGCSFELMIGKQNDFSTDSSLIHLAKGCDNQVVGGCCVNGTHLTPYTDEEKHQPQTFAF